ncbi:MAG: hypothetical protein AABZ53_03910 [Planctomycetota bacterium]
MFKVSLRVLTVCGIPLGALSPLAVADIQNLAQISLNPNSSGGAGPFHQLVNQAGDIDISGSTTGGANSSGSATIHVEYGLIQMSGVSHGTLGAVCNAYFRDRIVITAPGIPMNTLGTLTFAVVVDGEVGATSGSSSASWHVTGDVGGGASDISRGGTRYSPELGSGYTGDPFGTYQATANIQFGQGHQLHVELQGIAGTGYGQSGAGNAAFGSPLTLRWGGILNVTANGNAVTNYTVTADSGTDWTGAGGCAADFDGDGTVDFFDYDAFVACFEGGACPPGKTADFDGDGTVDFFDYDAFVVAFETPC